MASGQDLAVWLNRQSSAIHKACMTDEGARENAFGGFGYAGPPAHLISSVLPLVAGHTDALRHFRVTYLDVLLRKRSWSIQRRAVFYRGEFSTFRAR